MPSDIKITVNRGKEMQPAKNRGVIIRRTGSTAIISILASCSVAFIKPISAVKAEPARPENSKALNTGPNSRINDKETNTPRDDSAPKSTNVTYPKRLNTMPTKIAEKIMINSDKTPTE